MTNPSKRKGTAWETAVATHLNDAGLGPVERRALTGNQDRGDLAGLTAAGRWAVECKATRDLDLAAALDEAQREQANARAAWHVAIVKRRRRPTGQAYAVMTLDQLAQLLHALRAPQEPAGAPGGPGGGAGSERPPEPRTDAHRT